MSSFLGYNRAYAPQVQRVAQAQTMGSATGKNTALINLLNGIGPTGTYNAKHPPTLMSGLANLSGALGGAFGGSGGLGGANGDIYGDITNQRRQGLQDLLGQLSGFGGSERARIGQQYDTSRNRELARLESRGLGSSSLGGAAVGAVERERQQSLRGLEDSLTGQKVGLQKDFLEGIFGQQERGIKEGLDQRARQQQMLFSLLGNMLG